MKTRLLLLTAGHLAVIAHCSLSSTPPDTIGIRSALIIKGPPASPDDIARRDPIESAFVNGTWKTPRPGEKIRYNDTAEGTWERADAGASGWYDSPALDGGYVYAAIESESDTPMLLEAFGNSIVYVNGVCRSGNPYGAKDTYEGWEPHFDYSSLPVPIHHGRNEFLFACNKGVFKARLARPHAPISLNARDATLPDIVAGSAYAGSGSIVIINATAAPARRVFLSAGFPGAHPDITAVPIIQPFSVRKVPFTMHGNGGPQSGAEPLHIAITEGPGGVTLDTATVMIRIVPPGGPRKETFISSIDSSVQYYAITPSSGTGTVNALFLSLHGASVEAINQAASYYPKTWGHIVAPTNRRPYGFDWENWGCDDALEVLALVKERYRIDESRVYLTGHSMGGHGVYHIGSLYPDQFAAIGPSAGWITYWTYRGRKYAENPSPLRQMLARGNLPSETYRLAPNFRHFGVYILHGSEDDNVPPKESRDMVRAISAFHNDVTYHEQKGAGHWWDVSDAPGADCVDWGPMFDFFARHARPLSGMVRNVDFATPAPGISSHDNWIIIDAQETQFKLSSVSLRFEPGANRVSGTTTNVARMALDARLMGAGGPLTLDIDSAKLSGLLPAAEDTLIWLYREGGAWRRGTSPPPELKGRSRYGTFKDLFRNDAVFVYGTGGNSEEREWAFNKARLDAEKFWYQGNGSFEVMSDAEFNALRWQERNVVLYGNSSTNRAWDALLPGSPVQASGGTARLGGRNFRGGDIGFVFIRPKKGSRTACVGAVGGTGIRGMRLTDRMPYLLPGVAFPDVIIARSSLLTEGEKGVEAAGFFGIDWSVEGGDFLYGGKMQDGK
jgi:dienelactone hydrolase